MTPLNSRNCQIAREKWQMCSKTRKRPVHAAKSVPACGMWPTNCGRLFLFDWIRQPSNFRPSTQMPQFFGLWDHLAGDDLDIAQRV